MKKHSYFLISLHRLLFLFRSDVSNRRYYNYLCVFYECLNKFSCNYDDDAYKLLEKNLINKAETSEEQQIIKYILYKDKKISVCDNWEELQKTGYVLLSNIKKCILLYEAVKSEQLFDLLDVLEAYVEAVLKKDCWDKDSFKKIYIIPYEIKWKEKFFC